MDAEPHTLDWEVNLTVIRVMLSVPVQVMVLVMVRVRVRRKVRDTVRVNAHTIAVVREVNPEP